MKAKLRGSFFIRHWEYDERFTVPFIGFITLPEGSEMVKYRFARTKGFRPYLTKLRIESITHGKN